MHKCTNTQCTIVQMHKINSQNYKCEKHNYTNAKLYKCTNAQIHNAQLYKCTHASFHKNTKTQSHKITNAKSTYNTKVATHNYRENRKSYSLDRYEIIRRSWLVVESSCLQHLIIKTFSGIDLESTTFTSLIKIIKCPYITFAKRYCTPQGCTTWTRI